MSTNVRTDTIQSFWDEVTVETQTAVVPLVRYQLLTFPDTSKSLMIEPEKVEPEEELRQLFAEFAEEDIEMAEMGMDEYNEILLTEDVE
ncbi:MAG: hypothetical protein ACLFVG_09125 [Candidatus Aminicenantes bacterium]